MNKLRYLSLFLFFSNLSYADNLLIREKLKSVLPPEALIESIEPSAMKGIYKVYYGDPQPIYITSDGNFFIFGDMYKISGEKIINITNKDLEKRRVEVLRNIPSSELISFKSINEKYSVTIFTDVDCGYCKKLHSEIEEYNNLGITINYAAFPRSGIGTESFIKMVGAWCSSNPKKILSDLKGGAQLNLPFCDTQPVAKHYVIGQKLGVTGTPAIFTSSGFLIPGYKSPEELLEILKG
ncbi:MAG: thiol:disulfide interchange protein DsbC [Gammaproteobacteria bacterium]|jgi:thiol:disulfide interchange protein DsbC|tara:strand:+ start:270 stop:983 length:714 start_codon:yes stop_codon:yes gene_type:complete